MNISISAIIRTVIVSIIIANHFTHMEYLPFVYVRERFFPFRFFLDFFLSEDGSAAALSSSHSKGERRKYCHILTSLRGGHLKGFLTTLSSFYSFSLVLHSHSFCTHVLSSKMMLLGSSILRVR